MSDTKPSFDSMLLERDATLAVFKPRYFGGDLIAVFTQVEDENYIGILRNCDGWQHFTAKNPWYPIFRGKDATTLIEKVRTHVNSVPEEHVLDWLTSCFTLEHAITEAGWNDHCYPDHSLEVEFEGWELPYGVSREWVGETLHELSYEYASLEITHSKMSDEQKAKEIEGMADDIDRIMTLKLDGGESKDEAREMIRDYISSH